MHGMGDVAKGSNASRAIKAARQRYNAAIVARDVDAICAFLTPDYHVVTGRGVQSHGVEEQRQRWQAAFAQDPLVVYRRRTLKVSVRSQLHDAQEQGRWVGKYTPAPGQVAYVAGVYAAKWQLQKSGLWLIQTEVFTTLRALPPKSSD